MKSQAAKDRWESRPVPPKEVGLGADGKIRKKRGCINHNPDGRLDGNEISKEGSQG